MLKGTCLRHMRKPLQAEECLRQVLRLDKKVKEDTYLLPFAAVELALLAKDQDKPQLAVVLLEDAKSVKTQTESMNFLYFVTFYYLFFFSEKITPVIRWSLDSTSEFIPRS